MKNLGNTVTALLLLLVGFNTGFGQSFSEISAQAGIDMVQIHPMLMGGGVAFFDYDNDGFQDLYITGGSSGDKLYHNNGDATFTDVTIAAGIIGTDSMLTIGVATGDIDNDGYREIFITTWQGYPNILFKNNGNGTFTDISLTSGVADSSNSISVTFGDVNKDGFLDIYVANYVDLINSNPQNGFDYTCFANFLYLNNGNQTFTESGVAYGVADTGCALATAFTNFDDEGDIDVYIANDFGAWVRPNTILQNNFPTANYTDIGISSSMDDSIFGMGIAIGDYDEDGDLDYYVTNLGKNVLRNNQGNNTFLDKTDTSGTANTYTDSTFFAVGWGTAFFDYDNDTYLDLIIANGYIPADSFIYNTPSNPNVLFRNNGDATFTDVSDIEGFNDTTFGRGLALGDIDMDGKLDVAVGVVVSDSSSPNHFLLYENLSPDSNNWLSVSLQGVVNNRDGFGSRIRIVSNGRSWIREIDGGSSHVSQNMSSAYFGLGASTIIDSLIVTWLDGNQEVFTIINPNQHINIIEDSTIYGMVYRDTSICNGDSIPLGGGYQTTAGIYRDTMIASSGNDSIVVTTLSINPETIINTQVSICSGDSLYLEGTYQYNAGTYYDTIQGTGCDSIIVTDLVVLSAYLNTIDTTICESDTFLGNTYVSDTSLIAMLTGSNGCDSTVVTNITVNPFIIDTSTISLCQGDLYNGTTYSVDTTLIDTMQNQFSCDSIISISIVILSPSFNSASATICKGDLFAGSFHFSDTSLIDSLTGVNGCDSIVNTMLMVDSTYSLTIDTTIESGTLYNGVAYFSDTVLIESLLSTKGCDSIVQSNIYVVTGIKSSNTLSQTKKFNVFPNPASGNVSIYFDLKKNSQVSITIFNMLGKIIGMPISGHYSTGIHTVTWNGKADNGLDIANGIYTIRYSVDGTYTANIILIVSNPEK